ncbi:hypothetical protein [Lactiplantibacillus plantarum]
MVGDWVGLLGVSWARLECYLVISRPVASKHVLSNPSDNDYQNRYITIPKGTVVSGQPVKVKHYQVKKIVIKSSSLSYHLKKAAVLPGYYLERV